VVRPAIQLEVEPKHLNLIELSAVRSQVLIAETAAGPFVLRPSTQLPTRRLRRTGLGKPNSVKKLFSNFSSVMSKMQRLVGQIVLWEI
jgi:hypothetical protein